MTSKPSQKPAFFPEVRIGLNASSFSIVKQTINGHQTQEVVFSRLLDSRTSFTYLFSEINDFVEKTIATGEIKPEDRAEFVRSCRNSIARWAMS